ncbi:MAG TPA: deoxyguanosinetriphosphate triphosphohydrolase [Chthoniobacterales bacterium]|nr:deoxyguanosinetriphosphate triphosphohydrolase [Chthoniobacterales bacterium]
MSKSEPARPVTGVGGQDGYRSRQQMEAAEKIALAPFAQKSADSRGRKYPEPSHAYRTEFQRDRARIIHSRAFRRLEYKTQVFLNGTGDHLRTRLTHSIEVASISRTIARALGLNEDLAEAIALAHDLGHSPFGHSGEEMLAECMRGYGGFDHNRQSLRVVELLEDPYPDFPGLNLTFEVREGLKKHDKSYDIDESLTAQASPVNGEETGPLRTPLTQYRFPSLEAQIADLADEITYYSHDLDDAVDFQILSPEQLEQNAVWQASSEHVKERHPESREPDLHRHIIRDIIDVEVQDVVSSSARAIAEAGVASADDVRTGRSRLICYSRELAKRNSELRKFLYQNVYYHPRVAEVNQRACEMLRRVFEAYLLTPEKLGDAAARRIDAEGLHRTVCDYIAGMTDRYLMEEHSRLTAK